MSDSIAAGHSAHVRGKVAVEALPHRMLLHLQLPQQVLQAGISRSQGIASGDCLEAGFLGASAHATRGTHW
jgi:hypothetical protein